MILILVLFFVPGLSVFPISVGGLPSGNDSNPKTIDKPVACLEAECLLPCNLRKNSELAKPVKIIVGAGTCHSRQSKSFVKFLNNHLAFAAKQYLLMANALSKETAQFPRTYSKDGVFETCGAESWTSGFFPGSLWYLFEETGNDVLKKYAEQFTSYLEYLQYSTTNHDIGWIINSSVQNGYQFTQNENYKNIVVQTAKSLIHRFNPTVGCIRCWDESKWIKELGFDFPVNIDNMMNLELLMKAFKFSGDSTFREIAVQHADNTIKNQFRTDFSSYHVVNFNSHTGEVKNKKTVQGYSDESSWARGQAWGLYGFTMMYRETGLIHYLTQAVNIANFLTTHMNFPEDKIPFWDFDSPDIPNTNRDASAGAIMCSALVELSGYVDKEQSSKYLSIASQQLINLSSEFYRAALGTNGNFILKHAVGSLPANYEVDVPVSYADYYYIEALIRYRKLLNGKY